MRFPLAETNNKKYILYLYNSPSLRAITFQRTLLATSIFPKYILSARIVLALNMKIESNRKLWWKLINIDGVQLVWTIGLASLNMLQQLVQCVCTITQACCRHEMINRPLYLFFGSYDSASWRTEFCGGSSINKVDLSAPSKGVQLAGRNHLDVTIKFATDVITSTVRFLCSLTLCKSWSREMA